MKKRKPIPPKELKRREAQSYGPNEVYLAGDGKTFRMRKQSKIAYRIY